MLGEGFVSVWFKKKIGGVWFGAVWSFTNRIKIIWQPCQSFYFLIRNHQSLQALKIVLRHLYYIIYDLLKDQ